MSTLTRWLREHSLRQHMLAPLWLRIPEKKRWRIVQLLNRSQRQCWSDLVSDALAYPEDDACDIPVPRLRPTAPECATTCHWVDHAGVHDCACYCGKFRFSATDGVLDRSSFAASSGTREAGER